MARTADEPRPELPPVENDPREQEEEPETPADTDPTESSAGQEYLNASEGTSSIAQGAMSDEWMRARAEELGVEILPADDYTLQLDLDSDDAWKRFLAGWELLKSLGSSHSSAKVIEGSYELLTSKSGNRHVLVKLKDPLPVMERVLLQAALGSDLDRELLCWAGVRAGKAQPVVLFRPRTTS